MLTKINGATLVYSEDDARILGKGWYWIRKDWWGSQLFRTKELAIKLCMGIV